MIRHGPLSQSDAERLSATMQQSEDNKRRLDSLQPMDVLIIPAKFTGGANGAHAWTRQRIDATGGRYDDPLTFTGMVSGVSSMTVTWQPARLPGGGTLGGFPVYGYVTPIGLTPSTGPNFEVLVAESGGAKFCTFGLASTITTTITSVTSCTVYLYWGGVSPGANVTVCNVAASATTTFMFSAVSGKRGVAAYDEVNSKWHIIQLEC